MKLDLNGTLTTADWYITTDYGNWYNPETHELVEKKDAKIKRLKEELEANNSSIDYINDRIDALVKAIDSKKEEIKKIKKQLKELEV